MDKQHDKNWQKLGDIVKKQIKEIEKTKRKLNKINKNLTVNGEKNG